MATSSQYVVPAGALTLTVYTSAEASFAVNSIVITGKSEAVLVDAQFTQSDARAVADIVDKTGCKLRYIYVTHAHPDHYFGLDLLQTRFPDALLVAAPNVVERIKKQAPGKIEQWGAKLGADAPQKLVYPQPWSKNELILEGHRLSILGPLVGDTEDQYPIWIPESSALIAGDLLYCQAHLWTLEATADARKHWIDAIDKLLALKPKIVISGHQIPNGPLDASVLHVCREYLVAFDLEAKKAKTADELIHAIKAKYPNFTLGIALQLGAQAAVADSCKHCH
jgi:glyoxylase-like metal-dependent hydrolase (beta-lactamase superfamily II)